MHVPNIAIAWEIANLFFLFSPFELFKAITQKPESLGFGKENRSDNFPGVW
jgi:hypothetical protein